jgi:HEAT repeats
MLLALSLLLLLAGASATPPTEAQVRKALYPLEKANVPALKAMGPGVIPHLVKIYRAASEDERATVAWVFYSLGWKSAEAKAALMKDIGTQNPKLRPQVQWALGRVSDDADVVETLAAIMRNDSNPFFRDKAACALAYDQIHLTEKQKFALYSKLIDGLGDAKPDVRAISIQALRIHTGQDKGFAPNAPPEARARAVNAWKRWLEEYRRNL